MRAAGSDCPDSSWPRAARSSAESRLLHSCSSCSRAAILSQRPGPRGPRTVQPVGGEGSRPQGAPSPRMRPSFLVTRCPERWGPWRKGVLSQAARQEGGWLK